MITIQFTMTVTTSAGARLGRTGSIEVGAIDVFHAVAPADGAVELDLTVEDISTIEFVSIESDNYEDLTFTVGDGSPVAIVGPVMLVGAGQVGLLGAALATIEFANADTEADANIRMTIGRSGLVAATE